LPPSSPEIILDADGIPSDAFGVMESVNYRVNPWIFSYYSTPIPEYVELLPNDEKVTWSDDQRLPQ